MTSVSNLPKPSENVPNVRRVPEKWPHITVKDAKKIIEDLSKDYIPETRVSPVAALDNGRILAEPIHATEDIPNSRISIKDGYAVRAEDGIGTRLVVGFSTAGSSYKYILQRGECIRISTGSVIPDGANAVVPVEDTVLTKFNGDVELEVNFLKCPQIGQDIRECASDVRNGELILDVGCELGSAEIGLLNAFGYQNIEIFRKPRVCVLSVGDELLEPDCETLPLGFIRDSNRSQLLALFRSQSFKPIDAGITDDRFESIEKAIRVAANYSSVVVMTGGVGHGENDLVKETLNRMNFRIEFGSIFLRQGLNFTVAHGIISGNPVIIFALPGNPVSSWVCAHQFVTPFLRTMAGHSKPNSMIIKVKISHDIQLGNYPEYCRGWLESIPGETYPIATVTGNRFSSRLASIMGFNILLILPSKTEKELISCGDLVDAVVISRF